MEARWRPTSRASMVLFLVFIYMISIVSSRASQAEEKADYNGWRILEVILEEGDGGDRGGTPVLEKLQEMEKPDYLEILRTRRDKGVAEVAVSPNALVELRDKQQENQIKFSTVVHDLGKKLEIDTPSLRAEPLTRGTATFDRFMKTNEILAFVKSLPEQNANKVTLEKIGSSVDSQPIYMVTITSNIRRRSAKPVIFIDGGIHAREWISPAAAIYTINQLLETPTLTRDIEWRIIPLLNPDGYKYSWTNNRLWRKNRASGSFCSGTDLNRNFGYHWGETGSSSNPCSGIYHGPKPFSEPESQALRDAMLAVKDRIHAYVSIHSYGQMILYPWGYTSQRDRYNAAQLQSLGEGMAQVIQNNDGTLFLVGSAAKVLYEAAGGSDDWVAGELKVPLSYTFELKDEGAGGFLLPEEKIMSAVTDFWLAMKYLAKQVKKKEGLAVRAEAGEGDDTAATGAETKLQSQESAEAESEALKASVAGPVTKQGQATLPDKASVRASLTDGSSKDQSEETPVSRDAAIQKPEIAVVQEPVVQLRPTPLVQESVVRFDQASVTSNHRPSSSVNLQSPLIESIRMPLFTSFARPSQIPVYRRRYYDSSEEDSSSSSSSEESSEESDEDK